MKQFLDSLLSGAHPDAEAMEKFFTQVIAGEVDSHVLAAVLASLRTRGETAEDLASAARATRKAARQFLTPFKEVADCVGTGGDGSSTFNISTTAALLAAACGVSMAKHGNRSVSSRSGSSDLLEKLGIPLLIEPQQAADLLQSCGFCFLHAPVYHAGFRHAAPVRKALGVRTLFNLLGPLVNPAKPAVMLLGVYTPDYLELVAGALNRLGTRRAWVVHGSGLDELALHGPSRIVALGEGRLRQFELRPQDFGLNEHPLVDLRGGDPDHNRGITQNILSGKGSPAQRQAVQMNCAALLHLWHKGLNLRAAAEMAGDALSDKLGLTLLEKIVEAGRAFGDHANC